MLYNRWKLKCNALRKAKKEWSDDHENQMRHYGLTLLAETWKVWSVRPKAYRSWEGCIMEPEQDGDFGCEEGVTLFIDTLNDIHYWGLKLHGESCREDIEEDLRKIPLAKQMEGMKID
ncbi:hypothetical protein EV127DRAFT_477864 [Xylaria flabelliformis]|nr:hypothetical protein EV127DRAFT_477864 [Xylaria flabelliformis]